MYERVFKMINFLYSSNYHVKPECRQVFAAMKKHKQNYDGKISPSLEASLESAIQYVKQLLKGKNSRIEFKLSALLEDIAKEFSAG